MKFTKATDKKEKSIQITFNSQEDFYYIDVSYSGNHPKDHEIRKELQAAKYTVAQNRGSSYTVTGGTPEELKLVESELKSAYGLIEPVEDVALLSRIAIEIAIGARIADLRGQSLTNENFPPGYDVVKAAQTDGFMKVCLETARNVLMILK